MFVNSDFSDLLRLFNAKSFEYLVIGGYALIQYAEPRYTKDLDLWISTDTENASAVYQSLQSFGAPLEGLAQKDFAEDGFFYQMGLPPVRIDILMREPVQTALLDNLKIRLDRLQSNIVGFIVNVIQCRTCARLGLLDLVCRVETVEQVLGQR